MFVFLREVFVFFSIEFAGKFTAPIAGFYRFSVTGRAVVGKSVRLWIRLNGEDVHYFYDGPTDYDDLTGVFELHLQAGDVINLHLKEGTLKTANSIHLIFIGTIISEIRVSSENLGEFEY